MFRRNSDRVDPVAVDALRQRIRAADEALVGIDTTLQTIQLDPGTLWRDMSAQAVAHAWWLAKVFSRAAVAHHHAVADPTPETLAQATDMVAAAEHWTVAAADLDDTRRAGRRTGPVAAEALPRWPVTPETQEGLWAALTAIVTEIRLDAERFLGFGFPRRFADSVAELRSTTSRAVTRFAEQYELRWSTVPAERAATTAEALRHLDESGLFRAGQSWWAPRLLGRDYERARRRPAGIDDLDVPDPWVLTDPRERAARERDPVAVEEIVAMWEGMRRPGAALELQRELDDARARGLVRRRDGRATTTPPWQSRYLVRFPVTLGGRTFAGGDVVALVVDLARDPQVRTAKSGRVIRPGELLGQLPDRRT